MRLIFVVSLSALFIVDPGTAWTEEGTVALPADQRNVLRVSSLADSGPGSLRRLLRSSSGPRDIVFDVAGSIDLKSNIVVREGNVRILGETAPPPGITLRGGTLELKRSDITVSHLAIRVGPDLPGANVDNRDGVAISGASPDSGCDGKREIENIVLDHVSITWGVDENVQLWGCNIRNVTISNSIIAEALNRAGHSKGQHSMGLVVGPGSQNILIYRTLFVSNKWRNPALSPDTSTAMISSLVYNPGDKAIHIYPGQNGGPTLVSLVGNKVIAGPSSSNRIRLGQGKQNRVNPGSRIYLFGNLSEGNNAAFAADGVTGLDMVDVPPVTWAKDLRIVGTYQLEEDLLNSVGPKHRDATDLRLIKEVRSRTGSIKDTPPPAEWN